MSTTMFSIGEFYHNSLQRVMERIIGSNNRFNVSVMGVNSRGAKLAGNFAFRQNDCNVIHICDVDSGAVSKCISGLNEFQKVKADGFTDFRKSLESKDVDILVIAAPDHWHAPASLIAMQAGKHVYVEKPCSHNPKEGEILVEAANYYKDSSNGKSKKILAKCSKGDFCNKKWGNRKSLLWKRMVFK